MFGRGIEKQGAVSYKNKASNIVKTVPHILLLVYQQLLHTDTFVYSWKWVFYSRL
jgi:hypothetical protein